MTHVYVATTLTPTEKHQYVVVHTGASDLTVTLFPVSGNGGKMVTVIMAEDSGAGDVVIDGNAAETINGFASVELLYPGHWVDLVTDGTDWYAAFHPETVLLPEADRVSIVSGYTTVVTAGPNYVNVDASAYVPLGARQAIIVADLRMTGDALADSVLVRFRVDGSAQTVPPNVQTVITGVTNLGTALALQGGRPQMSVGLAARIFEHSEILANSNAPTASLTVVLTGYSYAGEHAA